MCSKFGKYVHISVLLLCTSFSSFTFGADKSGAQLSSKTSNKLLNDFLQKQNFPKQLSKEIIEELGLLRDGHRYGEEDKRCKTKGFYFAGVEYTSWPFLFKTITPNDDNDVLTKPEYEQEFKKIVAKFGAPFLIIRSKDRLWPPAAGGDIEYIVYKTNYNGFTMQVRFYISGNRCLLVNAYYELSAPKPETVTSTKEKVDAITKALD